MGSDEDEDEDEEDEEGAFTLPRTQTFDDDEEDEGDIEQYGDEDVEIDVEELVSIQSDITTSFVREELI